MDESGADSHKRLSRRDFLKLCLGGTVVAAEAILIDKLIQLRQQVESIGDLGKPDIDIPPEQLQKINLVDTHLKSLTGKMRQEEGGVVPELNSDSIFTIYLAKTNLVPGIRNGFFRNPNDFKTWITEQGSYGYDFEADRVLVTGGIPERQTQAREIFDAYMKKDQYRVVEIKLTDRNHAGGNTIQWEAGAREYSNPKLSLPWGVYGAYIHELTHAGIPLNESKMVDGKPVLLPYGLRQTLNFVDDWLEAMNQEYEFFQKRFFRAEGDQTLGRIRKEGVGNFGSALNEIVAMSCADYIFPPLNGELIRIIQDKHEPFGNYPLTERAIRKSIAYVHHGVAAGNQYPDGIEQRNGFVHGTFAGDLFWKIYEFTKSS